jgi:cell wall assembly regulator SMI1
MAVATITSIWRRIYNRLVVRVPKQLLALRGVSERQICQAEKEFGHRLPNDVRDFYKIHNGLPGLELYPDVNIGYLLPLVAPKKRSPTLGSRCVVEKWRLLDKANQTTLIEQHWIKPRGPILKVQWTPDWIPLFDNTQGDYLFLDMNPPKRGKPGQLIDWSRDSGPWRVFARSFRIFLERLANDLERDRYLFKDPQEFNVTIMKKSAWKKIRACGISQ